MSITWKYKIDVKDLGIFDKMSKELGNDIPKELVELIVNANAASPNKERIIIDGEERVLGAILSFNENEKDTFLVESALKVISRKDVLPFGVDPAGNYFCYSLENKNIIFWDHEVDDYLETEYTLKSFLDSLF